MEEDDVRRLMLKASANRLDLTRPIVFLSRKHVADMKAAGISTANVVVTDPIQVEWPNGTKPPTLPGRAVGE